MLSVLDDLWYGNIAPFETCGVGNREIENVNILMEQYKTQLLEELNMHDRAGFKKYAECAREYCALLSKAAFEDGFLLALRIMTEITGQG